MNIGLLSIVHNKVWDFRPDMAQDYANALKNAIELHLEEFAKTPKKSIKRYLYKNC